MPTPPPWWKETQEAPLAVVEQGIEDRPVGDRVGAVTHGLCLAVRGGDRAGVEVIAADHDRRLDFTASHQLVEGDSRPISFSVPQPADSRG